MTLKPEVLKEIEDQFTEAVAGYCGFLSWAAGEIEEEGSEPGFDQPWRAAFLVFAGRGKVILFRQLLEENHSAIDPQTVAFIEDTDRDLDLWLEKCWNEVAGFFDEALPFLLSSYQAAFATRPEAHSGWDFDDFIDSRDILEFFFIGVGDLFPVASYAADLREKDRGVREAIDQLGLETFTEEFFPSRVAWYPERFWWHHAIVGKME